MATTLANTENAPIPLKPRIAPDQYEYALLERKVAVGGDTEKRTAEVPLLKTKDVEYLLCLIHEFNDARNETLLSLTNDPNLRTFFRECLRGPIRAQWDVLSAIHPATVQGFDTQQPAFIERFTNATDFANQQRFLSRVSKPTNMTVSDLFLRVQDINQLMRFLPGANAQVPYNANGLKHLLYNMMPQDWKSTFESHRNELENADFTLHHLENYMSIQERHSTGGQPTIRQPRDNRRSRHNNNNNNNNNRNNNQHRNRDDRRRRRNDNNNHNNNKRQKTHDIRRNGGDCRHHPGHHDW